VEITVDTLYVDFSTHGFSIIMNESYMTKMTMLVDSRGKAKLKKSFIFGNSLSYNVDEGDKLHITTVHENHPPKMRSRHFGTVELRAKLVTPGSNNVFNFTSASFDDGIMKRLG
jgi:hypothetical protein